MHLYVSGCKSSYCRDKGAAQQHSAVTDVGTAWLSLRLDVLVFAVLTAAALLEVASDVTPALAGLSLIYALDVTKFLKFGTRIASKTETDFNSVERNAQYLQVSSTNTEQFALLFHLFRCGYVTKVAELWQNCHVVRCLCDT